MVTNNIEEYKGVYVFAQQVDNEISGIALEHHRYHRFILHSRILDSSGLRLQVESR